MGNSPRTASIHVLDDDSLRHMFYLYRPFLLGEDGDANARLLGGHEGWVREHWWYKLAHVCQRWRAVILGSASYLGLSLVCTYGTPVADMLDHSPPLPLVIDYNDKFRYATAEDEEGASLAFKKHDRICRIRLWMPVTSLQKFIMSINEEYPILEHLVITLPVEDKLDDASTILRFPETLHAPHLRHLRLRGFALPIESQLLTTAVGLVTLSLIMVHPSTYFYPDPFLRWISLMPQLEMLTIYFKYSIPSRDVERQLIHMPVIAPVTLPNLHFFQFLGVSTYLEAFAHRITTPRLEKLDIFFSNKLMFSVPRLLQFINTTENLRFDSAQFRFRQGRVYVMLYPHGKGPPYVLSINVHCWHLDWQLSSIAQISNSLGQIFSPVEHLALVHEVHGRSSEEHNEVDRTEWRNLFRPFRNVKTLRIDNELVRDISCCLQVEDGELSLELLPELQELTYKVTSSGSSDIGDAFNSFINARRNAGRSVTLVRG